MVIASWLVALDPQHARSALAALRTPGREIRDKKGSRWLVLLTESEAGVEAQRAALLATPGVQAAEPVASFDDDDTGRELVRW